MKCHSGMYRNCTRREHTKFLYNTSDLVTVTSDQGEQAQVDIVDVGSGPVQEIIIDNPGSGYSNRKILVDSNEYPSPTYFTRDDLRSGISTANNYMYFENHGFKSGELVEYKIVGVGSTAISGLSTNYS